MLPAAGKSGSPTVSVESSNTREPTISIERTCDDGGKFQLRLSPGLFQDTDVLLHEIELGAPDAVAK